MSLLPWLGIASAVCPGYTTYLRKIVMRYNYLSQPALTLFPGMPGSTLEQSLGRITQIEINPDLSIRSEVVRLWHTLFFTYGR
jgi:hypothetical protein